MAVFDRVTRDYRDLLRKQVKFGQFDEGDFSNPEQNKSLGQRATEAAALTAGGWYLYRGMRGAGYYPLNAKFWQSLETIKQNNIKRFIRKEYREYIGKLNKDQAEALFSRLNKTGFGLRGIEEGITSLFSRTISEIPEFFRFLGFGKLADRLKKIPDFILKGDPTKLYGFYKLPPEIRAALLKGGFKPGVRTIKGLAGAFGKRLALPLLGAFAAYKVLDSVFRGTTDEQGGIKGAIARPIIGARMAAQEVLSGLGITEAHKRMEETLPGYLRVAGIVGGAIWGIKGTRGVNYAQLAGATKGASKLMGAATKAMGGANRFVAVAVRALMGGVAGIVAEKFLEKSPEELKKIYSGEKEIPVRKGRWWMFGRTPYEGGRVDYFRPHWYPMMMAPETKLPESQPMSVSGAAFTALSGQGFPERPVPVGTGEWLAKAPFRPAGRGETAAAALGIREINANVQPDIAGPLDPRVLVSETVYRGTELMGLPGFVIQQMLKSSTGSEVIFDTPRAQTPGLFGDPTKQYWDRDLGGMLGLNEVFRRFIPPRRKAVEYYNPVPNSMGQKYPWLPGPDYYTNFRQGDPYSKLKMGPQRLPGPAYEALHKLESGQPGVYGEMDIFKILGDVAPYSREYNQYKTIVGGKIARGEYTPYWEEQYKEELLQREQITQQYVFYPKRRSTKEVVEGQLTEENEKIKDKALVTEVWEGAIGKAAMLPVPGLSWIMDKVLPFRSPLEHYKKFQVYGTESANWGNPIRDFVVPYVDSITGLVNDAYIPPQTRKRNEIEEYFDKLKYLKFSMLAGMADEKGVSEISSSLKGQARNTVAGLNPYASWGEITRAIPKRERAYFPEFVQATGEEREDILKVVPEYMRTIYEAQWANKDKRGRQIERMFAGMTLQVGRSGREGVGIDELNKYFSKKYLPGPKWAGWHPSVDLEQVKLKVVKNEALDIHDFDLWEAQENEAKGKKVPFIDEFNKPNIKYLNPYMRRLLLEQMMNMGMTDPQVDISYMPSDYDGVDLDFNITRDVSSMYADSVGMVM